MCDNINVRQRNIRPRIKINRYFRQTVGKSSNVDNKSQCSLLLFRMRTKMFAKYLVLTDLWPPLEFVRFFSFTTKESTVFEGVTKPLFLEC